MKATKHIGYLASLADRLPNIAKHVGEGLEATGVLMDCQVALVQVALLSLQLDSAVELIVAELSLDRMPNGVGSVAGVANDVENVGGDGVEDPIEKTLISHLPLRVAALGGGKGSKDM